MTPLQPHPTLRLIQAATGLNCCMLRFVLRTPAAAFEHRWRRENAQACNTCIRGLDTRPVLQIQKACAGESKHSSRRSRQGIYCQSFWAASADAAAAEMGGMFSLLLNFHPKGCGYAQPRGRRGYSRPLWLRQRLRSLMAVLTVRQLRSGGQTPAGALLERAQPGARCEGTCAAYFNLLKRVSGDRSNPDAPSVPTSFLPIG